MKTCTLAVAALLVVSCASAKGDLEAFCNATASMPRETGEASEHYIERVFFAAEKKVTNNDARSILISLTNLDSEHKTDFLRRAAREQKVQECPLADLWEWEVTLKETRPRPSEGVQLLFTPRGDTSFEHAMALARDARSKLEPLGLKATRIVTARCPLEYWSCVSVETGSVEKTKEIEAALDGLKLAATRPIHQGQLSSP